MESYAAFAAETDDEDYAELPKNPKREKQKRARAEVKRRLSKAGPRSPFVDSEDEEAGYHTAKSHSSRPGK